MLAWLLPSSNETGARCFHSCVCALETGVVHASEELALDSAVLSSSVLGEPHPA